jgi:hypothetical protein
MLFSLAVVGGVVAIFVFVAKTMVERTRQFGEASRRTLPGFAEKHGMRIEPHGSPDRLVAIEGVYEGVSMRIELVLFRMRGTDTDGHPTVHLIPSTRITAAADPALEGPFEIALGPSRAEGFARTDAPGRAFEGDRAARLAAFGLEREAKLSVRLGQVVIDWHRAEDDALVLTNAADLAVAFARPSTR